LAPMPTSATEMELALALSTRARERAMRVKDFLSMARYGILI